MNHLLSLRWIAAGCFFVMFCGLAFFDLGSNDQNLRRRLAGPDFMDDPLGFAGDIVDPDNIARTANGVWDGTVQMAEEAGLPRGTESKVAAGIALTVGGGIALYAIKKVGGWISGSSSAWPCECCTMKWKRNTCDRCKATRPGNQGQPWICACGDKQRAKDRKCFSCNTYQVWHCTSCMNSGSKKRCKKCDTESSWRCGCRKDNKRNVKNKKCPKCKALRPRQGWEDEANGFKDSKDKDILGLHNLESKRKGQDRVWLGVFPNKMSGIIVITSGVVMVIVGVVLAYIFCKKKKKVMYLPGP